LAARDLFLFAARRRCRGVEGVEGVGSSAAASSSLLNSAAAAAMAALRASFALATSAATISHTASDARS
jgi:hypothetical protein